MFLNSFSTPRLDRGDSSLDATVYGGVFHLVASHSVTRGNRASLAFMAIPVHLVGDGIDWPAWVQAVGSVLAIVAAFVIATWEGARDRRERKADRREFRLAVARLARRLADGFRKDVAVAIHNPGRLAYDDWNLLDYEMLTTVLAKFDPSQLVSAEGAMALEHMLRMGRRAPEMIERAAADYRLQDETAPETIVILETWQRELDAGAVALEALA
jgi:hypothetical protein